MAFSVTIQMFAHVTNKSVNTTEQSRYLQKKTTSLKIIAYLFIFYNMYNKELILKYTVHGLLMN